MEEVRQRFRPDAVVIQCGADSIAYDKLGTHNCTIKGHAACVRQVKSWGLPLLVLGGGGYTIKKCRAVLGLRDSGLPGSRKSN